MGTDIQTTGWQELKFIGVQTSKKIFIISHSVFKIISHLQFHQTLQRSENIRMQISQHIIIQKQTRHIPQAHKGVVVQRCQIIREDHQFFQPPLITK